MSADQPIILAFGLPRSGTTWVGKILDSHPNTLYRHEPDSWIRLETDPVVAADSNLDPQEVRDFVAQLTTLNAAKICSKTPIFPKEYLTTTGFNLFRLSILLTKFGGKIWEEMPVFGAPNGQNKSTTRIVWKSIESLGRLGFIAKHNAPAKCVHIFRHPCGQVASVLRGEAKQRFDSNTPASEDYGIFRILCRTPQAQHFGLSMDFFRQCTPIERLAWRWLIPNAKCYEELQHSSDYMALKYEDLCANPLEISKKIMDHCDLAWSKQTEDFVEASTSTNAGTSYYSVFKDPVVAANRWKSELPSDDAETIMTIIKKHDGIAALYQD